MNYFLSLGSNIGDRIKNLNVACSLLEEAHIKILRSYKQGQYSKQEIQEFLNVLVHLFSIKTYQIQ